MSSSMRRRRSLMGFGFIGEVLVLRMEIVEPLDPQDWMPAHVTGLASDGYHAGSGHSAGSSKLPRERVRSMAHSTLAPQTKVKAAAITFSEGLSLFLETYAQQYHKASWAKEVKRLLTIHFAPLRDKLLRNSGLRMSRRSSTGFLIARAKPTMPFPYRAGSSTGQSSGAMLMCRPATV